MRPRGPDISVSGLDSRVPFMSHYVERFMFGFN